MSEKSEQLEFLWNVHSYSCTFIQFADAKAGVVIAWNGAQLAFLLNTGAVQLLTDELLMGQYWSPALVITVAAFFSLAAGMCLSFLVLMPNLFQRKKAKRRSASSELIFWDSVAPLDDEEYRRRVLGTNNFPELVASHVHELARVASSKYRRLWCAFVVSFVAMACVVASTIAIQVNKTSTPNAEPTAVAQTSH